MVFIFVFFFFLASAIVFGIITEAINDGDYETGTGIFCVAFIVIAVILAITLACLIPIGWSQSIETYRGIEMNRRKIDIYQKRYDTLIPEFKQILLEKYPEYEKDIFRLISYHDCLLFMSKYPELHNIEATKEIISQINSNYNAILNIELKIEESKKDLKVWKENIFMFSKHYNTD